MRGARTATTCHRCQQQHIYGDEGWYNGEGKERHPFTPPPRIEQIRVETKPATPNAPAWDSGLFGALERCPRCKALVEPGDADAHDAFHALVTEVAAIAWRLAGQHDPKEAA